MLPEEAPPLMWKPVQGVESQDRQNWGFGFVKPCFTGRRRWTLVFIAVVVLQMFLLQTGMTAERGQRSPLLKMERSSVDSLSVGGECPYGKIFVYEIPAVFNAEIVRNCETLNPWRSRCDALSNYGLGKSAGKEMSSFMPERIAAAWYWTDQFALEVIHHHRILNYRCRTLTPEAASAFYIPIYAGLAIERYLFSPNSSVADRDRHCEMMLNWVKQQPFFQKSKGWDHFITMGRISWDFRRSRDQDWGSSCIYKPAMRNVTRLLIERHPWDYFDVGVPYPTGFHPSSAADVVNWQNFVRNHNRSTLFCFAGAARAYVKDDFRSVLIQQCLEEPGSCRAVDCSSAKCEDHNYVALESFLGSHFCLQPRGDSLTRRSVFDCMIAGAIPVFFWHRTAYMQYNWFLPEDPESYSVFIDRAAVRNGLSVKSVLEKISQERVIKMREKIIQLTPKLIYLNSDEGLAGIDDAFDIAMEAVLRRRIDRPGV